MNMSSNFYKIMDHHILHPGSRAVGHAKKGYAFPAPFFIP